MSYWKDYNGFKPFTPGGQDAIADASAWRSKQGWPVGVILVLGALTAWLGGDFSSSKQASPSEPHAAPMLAQGPSLYDVRLGMSAAEVQAELNGKMQWTVTASGPLGPNFSGKISARGQGGSAVVHLLYNRVLLVSMVASSGAGKKAPTEHEYAAAFTRSYGVPTSDVYVTPDTRRFTWASPSSGSDCGFARALHAAGSAPPELGPLAAPANQSRRCATVLTHTLHLNHGRVVKVDGALGNAGAIALALGG